MVEKRMVPPPILTPAHPGICKDCGASVTAFRKTCTACWNKKRAMIGLLPGKTKSHAQSWVTIECCICHQMYSFASRHKKVSEQNTCENPECKTKYKQQKQQKNR